MLNLKALFGTENQYFVLLASMSEQGRSSARALNELVTGTSSADSLKSLQASRTIERDLASKAETLLCKGRAAPFGRDDVDDLTRAVQAVPRSIRKFGERYAISRRHIGVVSFARELGMLENATDTLHNLVTDLQSGQSIPTAKKHNDALQKIEGEVDDIVFNCIIALYRETGDPRRALILKDLYELLDRTFDRCRSAGNLILRLVMKHS